MCSTISEFSVDSFDRFGDDLCQEILSYLSIRQCFRFQCVCKQFKYLAFNKITNLKIIPFRQLNKSENNTTIEIAKYRSFFNSFVSNEALNYVLNKCANINHLIIDGEIKIYAETITAISNRCKHLKLLTFDGYIYDICCFQQMDENSLKNLESLSFDCIPSIHFNVFIAMLLFTPKLRSIHCTLHDLDYITNANTLYDECFSLNKHHVLKNIESIKLYYIRDNRFIPFAEYFKHRLKSLNVSIKRDVNIDLLKYLACFDKLEQLFCNFHCIEDKNCIKILKDIGLRCVELKVLSITRLFTPLYAAFSVGFNKLEKLCLTENLEISENIVFLKNCVHLKYLKIVKMKIKSDCFANINSYFPQLNSIDILYFRWLNKAEKTNLLRHLAKLSNLCDLKIYGFGFCAMNIIFIDNCLSIKTITLYDRQSSVYIKVYQEYIRNSNRKIDIKYSKISF